MSGFEHWREASDYYMQDTFYSNYEAECKERKKKKIDLKAVPRQSEPIAAIKGFECFLFAKAPKSQHFHFSLFTR